MEQRLPRLRLADAEAVPVSRDVALKRPFDVRALVARIPDPSARVRARARWIISSERSMPKAPPSLAVRAASRVVSPLPHPMSRTWSRWSIPSVRRNAV
jgi:hypothetical protein